MPVKSNDLAIKALKPRSEPYEIAVRDHRGLTIRVHPSGERTFRIRYRQDGVLKRVALDSATLAQARTEWEARRADLKVGIDPAAQAMTKRVAQQLKRQEARAAPTVHQLATDFIELYAKRKKRSWRNDQRMLEAEVLPVWGSIKAAAITRRDVVALLNKIAATRPTYANRVLAVTRKMFNWAFDDDIIKASPCARVKPPGKETSRERVLSDDELRTFWTKLAESGVPPNIQTVLRLQLLTAARIGEIVGASWNEVDLKKGEWLLPATRTKNRRGHFVPLSPLAVSLFRTQARDDLGGDDSAAIFPAPGVAGHLRVDAVVHELAHSLPRLGLSGVRSHDLRRTCATKLAQLGTSRTVIEAILNHVDRSVGAIYDRHSYAAEKRAALEAWAKYLMKLVHGDGDQSVVPMKRSGKRS